MRNSRGCRRPPSKGDRPGKPSRSTTSARWWPTGAGATHRSRSPRERDARAMTETDARFEALLEYLRDSRGFDFTGYKRGTLQRRVAKRMNDVGIEDYADYQDHLEVHAE